MAHIVLNALSLRPGGGLQVAQALLHGMSHSETGHRYTVLCSDPTSIDVLTKAFANTSDIEVVNPVGRTNNMVLFVWQMTQLATTLKGLRADVMIGLNHHFPSGRVPQIVYHVNVLRFDRPARGIVQPGEVADRLRDWRARCALTRAAANVMESGYLLDLAARKQGAINDPSVVYIGQRSGQVEQATRHRIDGPQTLLALTSAQPHKDNPTLIHTLAELVRLRPQVDWRLEIAGGRGKVSFADLVALSGTLGVSDRVAFLGFQDHAMLAERAATALCLISTSRVESFSMVSLEAMSWACPPVVCDATSMSESIGDAGLLAQPGDATGFARQVLRLYEQPDLRNDLISSGTQRLAGLTWQSAGAAFLDLVKNNVCAVDGHSDTGK